VLLTLLDTIISTGAPDLGLRVARLMGDGIRRALEAVLTVYGEAVDRSEGSVTGIPSSDVFKRSLEPWSRYARLAPELGRWLTERHLSSAIDGFSLTATERYLADAGFIPPRDKAPPAVAFVDLVGYTRLAAEHGDQEAADVALDFAEQAMRTARRFGGRVVKLLGDGVLLHFGEPDVGVDASLALLDDVAASGRSEGHAGLAVGPVIEHDGDLFGTTVNLAARMADVASPGALLVTADAARHLESDRYGVEDIGRRVLQGFGNPIALVRISRGASSDATRSPTQAG
jgi:adenylate cyclase